MSTETYDSGAKGFNPSYAGGTSNAAIQIFPNVSGPTFNIGSNEGGGFAVNQLLATSPSIVYAKAPQGDGQIVTIKMAGFLSNSFAAPSSNSVVVAELGTAALYALLGYSGVTSSVSTTVSGGAVGSFPTNSISGTFVPSSAVVTAISQNQVDLANAITYFQGLTSTAISASYASHTFTATATGYNGGPGFVGAASSTLHFTGGTIILDGANLVNPVFVFTAVSAINVDTAATTISLINGATAANVVWLAGSSITFDAHDHVWAGQLLAVASVTLNSTTSMSLNGRALANTGHVTVSNTAVITTAGAVGGSGSTAALLLYNGSSLTAASNQLIGSSAQLFLPLIGTNPYMLSVSMQNDHKSGTLQVTNVSLYLSGTSETFTIANSGIFIAANASGLPFNLQTADVPFVAGVQFGTASAFNVGTQQQYMLEQ